MLVQLSRNWTGYANGRALSCLVVTARRQIREYLVRAAAYPVSVLRTDLWERIKKQYLVKPGFELSDAQQIELGTEYRFHGYVGIGDQGFDLSLSIVWKLGSERFSFEAAINGTPLTAIGIRVPYSEIDDRDAEVDFTVEAICRCMMDEIDSRSQRPE